MELETTRIFVKVLQLGSFTRAAEALKLPKSTVSRAVSRLEKESGTKLIVRTTRQLTPTAAGRAFYESCLQAIQTLEDARKSLEGSDSIIAGHIRITGPDDLGEYVISKEIAKLAKQYDKLTFELIYTDAVMDLVGEGIDLAIRIGKLPESRLKATKIGQVVLIPVASPDYLKKNGTISKPQELSDHDCLSYSHTKWMLKGKKETVGITVKPKIQSNQMMGLVRMALAGAGIACVPSYLCVEELKSGKLVRVLPDWTGTVYPVHLVSPHSSGSSIRIKVVIDLLKERLSSILK